MKIYRKLNSDYSTWSLTEIKQQQYVLEKKAEKGTISAAERRELIELDKELRKSNERKPQFSELENAVSDADKAKLKQLKAQLEKAADGTDEEFKKAQKAYDDFLDSKQNAAEGDKFQVLVVHKDGTKYKTSTLTKAQADKYAEGAKAKGAQRVELIDMSSKGNSLRIFRARNDCREEAQNGYGFLTEKTARQYHAKGQFIDYYTKANGDKKYAKISSVSSTGYTIGGDTFKFASYDH